mmetsp:Transcript_2182/g.4620  ORF Transcript_2182/g.4620 Transcript_2182/m.4620 type:complete len:195 (+) Transcript_2182:185-769(+)
MMVDDGAIGTDAISSYPRVNPTIPESNGALLAEEWTINLTLTLPSFLERMMMEETRRSGWQTLQSLFRVLVERMYRMATEAEMQLVNEPIVGVGEMTRFRSSFFRRWPVLVLKAFLRKLLLPLGPEIRFLLYYIVERSSLIYSNASISEALYGGKRVKLGVTKLSNQNERRNLIPLEKQDSVRLAFFFGIWAIS